MAIYKSKFTGAQVDSILSQVAGKQDKLTAGTGISISSNTISVTLDTTLFVIVSALPTANVNPNKIYLVPYTAPPGGGTVSTDNVYVEYIYADGKWEKIGEMQASVDLSGYATKAELSNLTSQVDNNESNIIDLEALTGQHTSQISSLTSRVTTSESNITTLTNKVTPITDDANYEVVLFKKA